MSNHIAEIEGVLQEWSPQTRLLQQIPQKAQRGLFTQDLNLTCVDAVPEYIAVGTNSGLVYWYDRKTGDLQRLRCENTNTSINCVRVVSTVDFMVAAGTEHGVVTVFQIPKASPDSVSDVLKPKNKQVERYTISGLHTVSVTAIEWSQNGMKLFSGDKNGLVVLTEFDFYMHLSKSMELLNEQFEIIQLNYCQQLLVISTVFRSIIAHQNEKWRVSQVGTKERKTLGRYGASFCKLSHGIVLHSSRPGQRIWYCDKDGTVQQTLIFKDALTAPHNKIQLINPVNKIDFFDKNFGKILQFGDNMLVVYNEDMLYVLHPGAISVVAVLDCARKILDVAVTKDEIFVLEGKRSLLRISYSPEVLNLEHPVPSLNSGSSSSSLLDDLASKLKDTAKGPFQKIGADLVFDKKPTTTDQVSPTMVGDEALELPPIVTLPTGSINCIVPDKTELTVQAQVHVEDNSRQQMLQKIGEQQFDEVVFRQTKRRREKKKRNTVLFQGQESESDTMSTASEDQIGGSTDEQSVSDTSQSTHSSNNHTQSSFSFLRDIPTLLKTAEHDNIKHNDELCRKYSEMDKTPDDKSQASIDTCESASENLVLTPDAFKQEQDKTFARLASLEVDDKTENMSVSMNMTPSSSVSSKISESLQVTASEMSENVSMGSVTKSDKSQDTDEDLPLPKTMCFYNVTGVSGGDSSTTSSGASQKLLSKNEQLVHDKMIIAQDLNLPVDVLPDLRSADVIMKDVKKKEKILSQVLNLDLTNSDRDSDQDDNSSNSSNDDRNVSNFAKDAEAFITKELITSITTPRPSPVHDAAGKKLDSEMGSSSKLRKSSECTESSSDLHEDFFVKHTEDLTNTELHFYTGNNEDADDNEDENCKNLLPECEQQIDDTTTTSSMFSCISYGPPSGSSANPSLDYNTGVPIINTTDPSDRWIQFKAPEPVFNLSICNNYVVCIDVGENVHFSSLFGLGLVWTMTDYKSTHVDMSADGGIVWVLERSTAFAFESPNTKGPFSEKTLEAALRVKTFALDTDECWLVSVEGVIKRQRNLIRVPVGRTEDVPCSWLVNSIACNNGLVLAVTTDNEVICKSKDEDNFKLVKTCFESVSDVAVGPRNVCWIVDDKSCIYFTDNITDEEPNWWQVLISEYVFQNTQTTFQTLHSRFKLTNMRSSIQLKSTSIAACNTSVWVYDKMTSVLHVNKTDIQGYVWKTVTSRISLPKTTWEAISGEGIFEEKGHLWMLTGDGDIFCTKPNSQHFQSVASPSYHPAVCISSCTDTLWVLSSDGVLYARLGLTENNLTGNSWREIDLQQLCDIHFNWISCGCDVVWGCDITGRVMMTVGAPHDMATNDMFQPAWLEVDGKPQNGNQFVKVYVGPHLHMVWAIDNKNNIYVREAIFPDFVLGTGWVYVAGIEAKHLSISGTCVWALTPQGSVYKRYGVTQNNYIGDYWKRIPGLLEKITTSVDDSLWGVDKNNQIVQLKCETVVINNSSCCTGKNDVTGSEDGDWEVVH